MANPIRVFRPSGLFLLALTLIGRLTAMALVHPRPPSPEPAKPLALRADDRVGSDVNQGSAQPVHSRDSPTQNNRSK